MLLYVLIIFSQRQTNGLSQATVHLAVNSELVVDLAHIGDTGHLLDRRLSGCDFHCDLGQEHAVHVACERAALSIFVALGGRSRPLAVVTDSDIFIDHFLIRAERTVCLSHATQQQFTTGLDGAADNHL